MLVFSGIRQACYLRDSSLVSHFGSRELWCIGLVAAAVEVEVAKVLSRAGRTKLGRVDHKRMTTRFCTLHDLET